MASLAIVARISVAAKDQVPAGTRIRRTDQCRIQVQYSAISQLRKASLTPGDVGMRQEALYTLARSVA